jgi:hypothetical protein
MLQNEALTGGVTCPIQVDQLNHDRPVRIQTHHLHQDCAGRHGGGPGDRGRAIS